MSYIALIGKKAGMTNYFVEDRFFAVTLIQLNPNYLIKVKTEATDGYNALVMATPSIGSKVNKPQQPDAAKLGENVKNMTIREFRINDKLNLPEGGLQFAAADMTVGQLLDITSTSKGKGFQGVMKMYGFRGQPQTHGTSLTHRSLGSTGCRQDPGRVFKNKKMPGRMGNNTRTTQNMQIVDIDPDLGVIVVKGSIPGNNGDTIYISDAIKSRRSFSGKVNGKEISNNSAA